MFENTARYLAVLACGWAIAQAGEAADVGGRVTGPTGQPIPGVTVTALPDAGGTATRVTSGKDGTFRFDRLADATYRLDFELRGFDLVRRNNVRVDGGAAPLIDVTLRASAICECVTIEESIPLLGRAGRVLDDSGRSLPHARLEIVAPSRREVAYADDEGGFKLRLPTSGKWTLTASDTGFQPETMQASGSSVAPIVFRLRHDGKATPPDVERFERGCRCPGDLFTHDER
jgi:hypothetical protein